MTVAEIPTWLAADRVVPDELRTQLLEFADSIEPLLPLFEKAAAAQEQYARAVVDAGPYADNSEALDLLDEYSGSGRLKELAAHLEEVLLRISP